MKQFDIFWVNLDPTVGSETQKKRPCVILSADIMNQLGKRVIIAPLLKGHKRWPYVVNVKPSKVNQVDVDRRIDFTQLRSVDKQRVGIKKGRLEEVYYTVILRAERVVLQEL